jgi:hypothetical protein
VLSYLYVKQLAAKTSKVKEFAAATVSNYTANSNAAACARGRAKQEYANLDSNIHLSKHSTTKHAIYGVVVQIGEGTGGSSSNVLLVDAADKEAAGKGSSILLQ